MAVAAVLMAPLSLMAAMVVSAIFRWRFQFGMRSLLVLVVFAAIPFSWLAVETKLARSHAQMVAEIRRLGGTQYDELVLFISAGVANCREPPERSGSEGLFG